MVLGALFYVASKSQHGLWFVFPMMLLAYAGWLAKSRSKRLTCALAALCLPLVFLLLLRAVPSAVKADPLFSAIFMKAVPHLVDPPRDLKILGLDENDLRYSGKSVYDPISPMMTERSTYPDILLRRTSYVHLFRFYAHHPGVAMAIMKEDLTVFAPWLHLPWLANYRREDGFSPNSLARHFDSWDLWRHKLFVFWPEHIIAWYAALLIACGWLGSRGSEQQKRLALFTAAIAVLGVLEFCFACFADANETDRHLFIFHMLTDLTLWMAATAVLLEACRRWQAKPSRPAEDLRPFGSRAHLEL